MNIVKPQIAWIVLKFISFVSEDTAKIISCESFLEIYFRTKKIYSVKTYTGNEKSDLPKLQPKRLVEGLN